MSRILKWGLLIFILGLPVLVFQLDKPINENKPLHDIPARILIPSIQVDAAVEQVSVTSDGRMDVPKLAMNVGWYSPGITPGETGSAVMAGHIDGPGGARAVFFDLHKLKAGDKIEIENNKGTKIIFTVSHTRTFASTADASDVFISADGESHLNLITCSGVWDRNQQDYTQRLVVFTNKD